MSFVLKMENSDSWYDMGDEGDFFKFFFYKVGVKIGFRRKK